MEVVHSIFRLLKLFCDNSAAISFFRNTRSTSRSKYIDVKFFFVKEKVAEFLILADNSGFMSNMFFTHLGLIRFFEQLKFVFYNIFIGYFDC